MYTPPPFRPDRAASLAFAQARGFGLVCAWAGQKPVASLVPFYLSYTCDGTPQAAFHVARHNPLAELSGGPPWLLAVTGPDAYVCVADRYVERQIRDQALAQKALDVGKNDGGTAQWDEEGNCGSGDDG